MRTEPSIITVLLLGVASGCGNAGIPTAKVTGRVTWNGEPVDRGIVYTAPARGPQSFGSLESDGTFELSSGPAADGVAVGRHRVYFAPPPPAGNVESVMTSGPVRRIDDFPLPEEYRNPDTSGLAFDVTANGPNEWTINLP